MKRYTLRAVCFCLALFFFVNVHAQQFPGDTLEQEAPWYLPDAAVLQFAGNMGMVAIGPGYEFAKERLTADLLYGYVPKFDSDEAEHLLTLKATYKPWKIKRRKQITVIPVQAGLGFSYYFNEKYSLSWPDNYPKNYYWWSPKVRVLGFAGTSVTKEIRNSNIDKIGLYAELGTYDLIATSWIKEREALRLWDILNISLGARVNF